MYLKFCKIYEKVNLFIFVWILLSHIHIWKYSTANLKCINCWNLNGAHKCINCWSLKSANVCVWQILTTVFNSLYGSSSIQVLLNSVETYSLWLLEQKCITCFSWVSRTGFSSWSHVLLLWPSRQSPKAKNSPLIWVC